MGLPAIVDSVEAVPESFRSAYVKLEDGPAKGKFALGVDPVGGYALEHVEGYKTTIGRQRESENALKAAMKAFEGLDAGAARQALADVEKLKDSIPKGKLDELVANQVDGVKRTMQAQLDKIAEQFKNAQETIRELAIDQAAASAIAAAGGNVDLLLPFVRSIATVEAVEGQRLPAVRLRSGGVVISTKKPGSTDPMTVSEYVSDILKDKYPQAFAAPAASGSGAGGGSGKSNTGSGARVKVTTSDLENPRRMASLADEAKKAGRSLTEYVEVVAS
jgi:hypothetical protein